MINLLGGRKSVGFIIALVVGIGISLIRGDVPANLALMIETLFAAFVAGNAIGKFGKTAGPGSLVISDESVKQLLDDQHDTILDHQEASLAYQEEALNQGAPLESRIASLEDGQNRLGVGITRANAALDEIINYIAAVEQKAAASTPAIRRN